jgi:hypothetical protein
VRADAKKWKMSFLDGRVELIVNNLLDASKK